MLKSYLCTVHRVVQYCDRYRCRVDVAAVANGVAGGVASLAAVTLAGAAAAAVLLQSGSGSGEAASSMPRSQVSVLHKLAGDLMPDRSLMRHEIIIQSPHRGHHSHLTDTFDRREF
jgi:hypothetical protein